MLEHPSRRAILGGGIAFTAWAAIPHTAVAAKPRDPRFVVVVLRGGMDGLAALAPLGDPLYDEVREQYMLVADGEKAGLPLDGFFLLNPRLPTLHKLYNDGEALFVHAVHTAYRQRSHFDAQDVLENGTTDASHYRDGWLGRAIARLPRDSRVAELGGFAAAAETPLVLRGAERVVSWLPAALPAASRDTQTRLLALYEHTDAGLAEALARGMRLDDVVGGEAGMAAAVEEGMAGMQVRGAFRATVAAATAAGRAMAQEDGPRVGFLDMSGFDTHRGQRVVDGFLGASLSRLDLAMGALREALGEAWRDTVVTVITEFGRTVRMNGTMGTDHGMATVAMLLGGAIAGGQIVADWPGLSDRALHEGRDLRPTTDLRAVLKGALRDHLGLEPGELGAVVFPGTMDLRPLDGLVRAASDQRAFLR